MSTTRAGGELVTKARASRSQSRLYTMQNGDPLGPMAGILGVLHCGLPSHLGGVLKAQQSGTGWSTSSAA